MKDDFDKELIDLEQEITNLKQAKLKWAGTMATADWSSSFIFTIAEVDYGLFSTKALEITATCPKGDSFLSQLMFSGSWDGRGYASCKSYVEKGKTRWTVAMIQATQNDYVRYYEGGMQPFNTTVGIVIRTTSPVDVTTKWIDNPYTKAW